MEIYQYNSRGIIDNILKFQNKEIEKNTFNNNIFLDIALNFFYTKKELKKTVKLKQSQNKNFQIHFKKETAQDASERILINKVKQKQETVENAHNIINHNRAELLNELLTKKDIKIFAEHTYDTYIPPKNYSLSMQLLSEGPKNKVKYIPDSDTNINPTPALSNEEKSNIRIIDYIEPLYTVDEDNDIILRQKNESKNLKHENNKNFLSIINTQDDLLFYSDNIHQDDQWLKDIDTGEIDNNFNGLMEANKNNRNEDNDDDEEQNLNDTYEESFLFDSYITNNEYDISRIFDSIPEGGDKFKKFEGLLTEKYKKTIMKKMNYEYLDLMLTYYSDLCDEIKKYDFISKKEILLIFVKRFLLQFGMSYNKTYETIIRNIKVKKFNNVNLDFFLDCFSPVMEMSDKYLPLKYKYLLFISKNKNEPIISMEHYKTFCRLIKGKWIYDENNYKKLSKLMTSSMKKKYPKVKIENYKFYQISAIIEYLVNNEYKDIK